MNINKYEFKHNSFSRLHKTTNAHKTIFLRKHLNCLTHFKSVNGCGFLVSYIPPMRKQGIEKVVQAGYTLAGFMLSL